MGIMENSSITTNLAKFVDYITNQNLYDRATEGNPAALFQLGEKAFFNGQIGFATVFFTAAKSSGSTKATYYLAIIEKADN